MNDSHQHGRRCTLAADIADAEEQLLVADEVVIEVAAYLTGRHQRSADIHIVCFQVAGGQHALLYLTGHTQFACYALFLQSLLLQLLLVPRKISHNE